MEASFRSRIDRTFGILNTESEKELHLWKVEGIAQSKKNKGLSREEGDSDDDKAAPDFLKPDDGKQEEKLANASFFGEDDLEELDSGGEDEDEDEEEQTRVAKKVARGNIIVKNPGDVGGPSEPHKQEGEEDDDEVREVRDMVGMDDTLDFEDEEDEYDRVAVGAEGTDDRLFMSRVRNFGTSREQLNPLPTNFIEMRQARSDRRANHKAALARLEEDDCEAATRAAEELSQATEEFKLEIVEDPKTLPVRQDNGGEAMDIDGEPGAQHRIFKLEKARDEEPKKSVEGCRVSKPRNSGKRVRFSLDEAAGVESNPDQMILHGGGADDTPSTATTIVARPDRYSKVPDYVKNPSKYIHYTLDWSDEDEESANVAAFHAARVVTSSSTQDMDEEAPQGPSGSTKISFNQALVKRRPKESDRDASNSGGLSHGVINIAANFDVDGGLGGIITMEDDQDSGPSSVEAGKSSSRVVRRYRNRMTHDIDAN